MNRRLRQMCLATSRRFVGPSSFKRGAGLTVSRCGRGWLRLQRLVSNSLGRSAASTFVSLLLLALTTQTSLGDDWPAFRHDARRSAVSADDLKFPLQLTWHRQAKQGPRPAFADPLSHPSGIDFAYTGDHSEPVLLDFDHAFHPIASRGRVFLGSSVDDSVTSLSLETGERLWRYVTGGPVRFAPHATDDRVYAASDDGFVYCLAAATGELIWRFRAAPSARQLVGNGRMISRWPLRSGVLVLDEVVYVTAGMWPSEGVFVYALNARTGAIRWVNDTSGTLNLPTKNQGAYTISGVAPTGYLLAGKEALVAPTGRSIPATYSLLDGRLLSAVAPSYQNQRGGPAICVDPHGSVIFGYPRERLTPSAYSVHYAYRLPAMQSHGTIRADCVAVAERTYVTVNDLIRCYDSDSRYRKVTVEWQLPCPSKSVHCMSLAANGLLMGVEKRVVARNRETGEVAWESKQLDGRVQSIAIADERLLAATDSGSVYCFASEDVGPAAAKRAPDVQDPPSAPAAFAASAKPLPNDLQGALDEGRIQRGLALVIGNAPLAQELAVRTKMQVVLLLEKAAAVAPARLAFHKMTLANQGQVTVQQHAPGTPLPFADYAFNVIVASGAISIDQVHELHRVLRPSGGILQLTNVTKQLKEAFLTGSFQGAILGENRTGASLTYRRDKLPGALDWDSEGKRDEHIKWPLELLWFGGPGSKRTGSGSRAPVSAGGRNLIIGKNHLIALDAYNGVELWARELPYLYRNIGRMRNAPGPIRPFLAKSVSGDDQSTYLNFGHVVFTLDAATGEQRAVHGEFPEPRVFQLNQRPKFPLDHYQKPDERGRQSTAVKSTRPAGVVQLYESGRELVVALELDSSVEVKKDLYWELFFDVRPANRRARLYERGQFHIIVKPAEKRVESGIGPAHPVVSTDAGEDGHRMLLRFQIEELTKLAGGALDDFCFAAALNYQPGPEQRLLAGGRKYLRWQVFADPLSYAFNNGWARVVRPGDGALSPQAPQALPSLSELPVHATQPAKTGWVGKKAGYVVTLNRERENPLSQGEGGFEYNRGKGCGYPVSSGSLHVLRSGSLAFYDLDDDSGMRYFSGVRPSCTISAAPAQGIVFAAEGSSGCNCNYNFKTTLALAPARRRSHEDWAVFMAPLSPGALLRTGRFNLAAPGDRRDDAGGLWLQFPRAPTYANRSMPVPIKLLGDSLRTVRVNADRVAISNTARPWLYASAFEGVEGVQVQLFMSDQDGIVVFPGKQPKLDAALGEANWERRYAAPAGEHATALLSCDEDAVYLGYEVLQPRDRRGNRLPWKAKAGATLSRREQFGLNDLPDDAKVWEADSLEFLVSDRSLKTILHFGVGVAGGRYDGEWSADAKREAPSFRGRWAGAIDVNAERAVAEIALPWKTLTDAGLDLKHLVLRTRTKGPLTRQPHITHGFRPLLIRDKQPPVKHYRVALHFAELSGASEGQRVFDIQIQGKTMVEGFDLIGEAGGPNRAVSRVFEQIRADRALTIRFVPSSGGVKSPLAPSLCAIEVLLEQ